MLTLQTLYDLDILTHGSEKASLYDKLNHCKTQGGKEALKKLFLLEYTNIDTAQQRQDAVSYLANLPLRNLYTISENDIFYTKSYLESNYTIVAAKGGKQLAALIKTFTGQKERLYFITAGVKNTLIIINTIKETIAHLSGEAPVLLKQLVERISELMNRLNIPVDSFQLFRTGRPSAIQCFAVDKMLREGKQEVMQLLNVYYQMEAYYSLAISRKEMELSVVRFSDSSAYFQIKGLVHPLVKNCVANEIIIPEGRNMTLITGPNMAGKSTYMKSIGLAFFMAYLGVGITADEAQMPVMTSMMSSINVEDDVSKGYSYFFTEVQHVKVIAEMITKETKTLVIIDELFKGTNVKDAMDCTDIVWQGFLKQKGCIFIISTHLLELAEQYKDNPQFNFLCFDAAFKGEQLAFDHTIKHGISALRLGRHILKEAGVPQILGVE